MLDGLHNFQSIGRTFLTPLICLCFCRLAIICSMRSFIHSNLQRSRVFFPSSLRFSIHLPSAIPTSPLFFMLCHRLLIVICWQIISNGIPISLLIWSYQSSFLFPSPSSYLILIISNHIFIHCFTVRICEWETRKWIAEKLKHRNVYKNNKKKISNSLSQIISQTDHPKFSYQKTCSLRILRLAKLAKDMS